jgi:hypothetical protein
MARLRRIDTKRMRDAVTSSVKILMRFWKSNCCNLRLTRSMFRESYSS